MTGLLLRTSEKSLITLDRLLLRSCSCIKLGSFVYDTIINNNSFYSITIVGKELYIAIILQLVKSLHIIWIFLYCFCSQTYETSIKVYKFNLAAINFVKVLLQIPKALNVINRWCPLHVGREKTQIWKKLYIDTPGIKHHKIFLLFLKSNMRKFRLKGLRI